MASQKQLELLKYLQQNPFVLAPMAAITDSPFRSFMKELGAGVVVSELISATGLAFNSSKTKELMKFSPDQHPVGIQLFGENAEHIANAASYVEQMGADFVDLNFGCPVPKVVKKGAGSAMLKNLPAMQKLLRKVVEAVQIPVTIKIRTGWDATSRNAIDVANLAYDEGITWVAIHGRTRAQGYEGYADWDYIAEVKARTKIPIIGNGDVVNPVQANHLLKVTGCDGIMIGRGALKNPFLLAEAQAIYSGIPSRVHKSYPQAICRLYEILNHEYSSRLVEIQFKKLVTWFATGFPHAAQFRKQLFQAQEVAEAYRLAIDFFEKLDMETRDNESNQGFLMGGHG
jgi:nifR3 family TIM-barrel protein